MVGPEVPALSPEAVAAAVGYADSWLAVRRRLLRLPGVQVAVWHGDGLALSAAHGLADVDGGVELRPDHLFRIASHSKTFTATAVFQLRDAGRLRLDDLVGDWLPGLREAGSPVATRTVSDLLGHAGGLLRDGEDADFWLVGRAFPDAAQLLAACGQGSAVLPAQTGFKYSNLGYAVLGLVVAAVAGEPYNAYVTREVVERLGLRDTAPELDPARAGDLATGYTGLAHADARIPIDSVDTRAWSPATGFTSTAADVCRYASAHFLGDARLLSDDAKRRMQRDQWEVEPEGSGSYGLGVAVHDVGGRRLVGHGGGYPGHSTSTLLDPEARLAVSVFTNAIDGAAGELAAGVVRLVDLAAAQAEPDGEAQVRARFCGRYANLWAVRDVADLGGRLFLLDPTSPDPTAARTELRIEDGRTLRIVQTPGYGAPGESLEFTFDDGGVRGVRGNGGVAYLPVEAHAAAMAGLDRVRAPQD